MPDTQFSDPKLVAIYNTVNPIDDYKDFYIDLAQKLSSQLILDIGAGTGLITSELVSKGFSVIAIEPSVEMLKVAEENNTSEKIQWINGDALNLEKYEADLAIMTGHVAQFYTDDETWLNALKSIHNALKSGGYLAFESRNPLVQPWPENEKTAHSDWPSNEKRRTVTDPEHGEIEWWYKMLEVKDNLMRYEVHYFFKETLEELVSTNVLKFRTRDQLTKSLKDAGFNVEIIYGDWEGNGANDESAEFIFIAKSL